MVDRTPADVPADRHLEAAATAWQLSRRETQVAVLLIRAGSCKVVAARLAISVHTVRLYLRRARRKTGARSWNELSNQLAAQAARIESADGHRA